MLARLQQFNAIVLLAAVSVWVGYFVGRGSWPLTLSGPAGVVAVYGGVLALEFWWLYRTYPEGALARPTVRQLLSAWLSEAMCAPQVFLWRQPFRSRALVDRPSAAASGRRGVVLVHGFFCNRGLWNPWLRRFSEDDVPFVAVNLEPLFGSIDRYAGAIDAAVSRLQQATGVAPLIVAHSMGGLAVRSWLARHGDGSRFHRVVTIATPHGGTMLAQHARTANGRQMRMDSPWLAALGRAQPPRLNERFTCFWSHCDNIVFPTHSATLAGADNLHLPGTSHVRMVYHPAVLEEVLRLSSPVECQRAGVS